MLQDDRTRVSEAHGFCKDVIRKVSAAEDFPIGPYPCDKLTYRNDCNGRIPYPPNAEGLGTASNRRKVAIQLMA